MIHKLLVIASAALFIGCAPEPGTRSSGGPSTPATSPAPGRRSARICPPRHRVFDGVYRPARFALLDRCKEVTGTVEMARAQRDGDVHIMVRVDGSALSARLERSRWPLLTVEFMPRDKGHLVMPGIGDRVTFTGALVWDVPVRWYELHPVWRQEVGGATYVSGPRFGGSPPWSPGAIAASTCRRDGGRDCGRWASPAPRAP